jgi:uncharacterized membrane protein YeiB
MSGTGDGPALPSAGPGQQATVPVPRGPVRAGERSIAPDVARGAALLGIALANAPIHLWGRATGPGTRPVEGTDADRAVDVLVALLADNRSYPLFALLLGYGTWQLATRQLRHGTAAAQVKRLLLRRSAALVALGLAHALLLFSGDILGLYGLLSLALVALLGARDRTLLLLAGGFAVPLAVLSALDGLSGPLGADPTTESGVLTAASWLPAVGDRLVVWTSGLAAAPLLGIGLLTPMLVGMVLARHGVLETPERHVRLLRRLTTAGIAVSLLGGLPFALVVGGVLDPPVPAPALAALHGLTGTAGGIGYVALVALLVRRRSGGGGVVGALAATGQRSLSAYLLQSVLLTPLLAPWALGWGEDLGTAAVTVLGVAVWLASVVACAALAARGRRGPAEVLLRRLVYGPGQPTERQGRDRRSAT